MSLNVLVLTEDFRKDQHVLRPIIRALFTHLGKSNASIRFCMDASCMQGVNAVMKWENIHRILNQHKNTFQMFVLLVDRDGDDNRCQAFQTLRQKARDEMGVRAFIPEHAWQEIEVWALAGCDDLPPEWNWADIRNEPNPKETYFLPYSKERGYVNLEHNGRAAIATQAAQCYRRIRQHCHELQDLEKKIQDILALAP